MWYEDIVFYQIYTLNFCDVPKENNGVQEHRLDRVDDYIGYLKNLGIGGVYFNPVFSSDRHGYDTRDYKKIDERLGTNEEFRQTVAKIHEAGMKVVLDGVFNHVGRGFFAFRDVQKHKWESKYCNWFKIDFNGNSCYDDGFWYEGWEGHYELVKLNLDNKEVQDYLLDSVRYWIDYFDIDGIRLDVAYLLPRWFMGMLSDFTKNLKSDFFLFGETLGDNQGYMFSEGKLDSITDYPGYKGFWSGFNSYNMFEIAHTLKRNMFEMYRGRKLWTFLDNHDVDRIASKLQDRENLPVLFGLQLSLPGIPCIYYGSEWGQEGIKIQGQSDDILRPAIKTPYPNELTDTIRKMISIRNHYSAMKCGTFDELRLTNRQYVFQRRYDAERIIVILNIDSNDSYVNFNADAAEAEDLLSGNVIHFDNGCMAKSNSIMYLKVR